MYIFNVHFHIFLFFLKPVILIEISQFENVAEKLKKVNAIEIRQ